MILPPLVFPALAYDVNPESMQVRQAMDEENSILILV
jgi:hypothetical protein